MAYVWVCVCVCHVCCIYVHHIIIIIPQHHLYYIVEYSCIIPKIYFSICTYTLHVCENFLPIFIFTNIMFVHVYACMNMKDTVYINICACWWNLLIWSPFLFFCVSVVLFHTCMQICICFRFPYILTFVYIWEVCYLSHAQLKQFLRYSQFQFGLFLLKRDRICLFTLQSSCMSNRWFWRWLYVFNVWFCKWFLVEV